MAHYNAVGLVAMAGAVVLLSGGFTRAQLSYDYYEATCPRVEQLVRKAVLPIFLADPTSPPAFLRLLFHDCQVQGCDSSILLDSDGKNIRSEMISGRNFGIRKREMIGRIKSILDGECPGQVSCADVIALVAREAVSFAGGPEIDIPLGRKDSITGSNIEADLYLPSPTFNVDDLLYIFSSKGMTTEESVAILGAHTLGVGHCLSIVNRLYNLNHNNKMGYGFEVFLRFKCPTKIPHSNETTVSNDLTSLLFDNQYYRDVIYGRGLFIIDSSISIDSRTAPIVRMFALDQAYFFQTFSSAFVKLSSYGILTGVQGEIRRECNRIN